MSHVGFHGGSAVQLAVQADSRSVRGLFARWLSRLHATRGLKVDLGQRAPADLAQLLEFDAIPVANGAIRKQDSAVGAKNSAQ